MFNKRLKQRILLPTARMMSGERRSLNTFSPLAEITTVEDFNSVSEGDEKKARIKRSNRMSSTAAAAPPKVFGKV